MMTQRDGQYDRVSPDPIRTTSASDGKTHLVVIQPSSFCNIDCHYCYVRERLNKTVISKALVEEILQKVFRSERLADGFRLVWHNGEPLTLGIEFYRSIQKIIEKSNIRKKPFVHCIQTNATLIDDKWIDLFNQLSICPSVSIDGPQHVHDLNRVTRSGRGTFHVTMNGIKLLRRRGIKLGGLCVVSSLSMPFGRDIANFFINEGFSSLGLVIEGPWGANQKSSLPDIDGISTSGIVTQFIEDFYEAWYPHRKNLDVREFTNVFTAMKLIKHTNTACVQQEDATSCTVVSFDREGNISTFSPQMVMGVPGDTKRFVVANINEIHSLDELPSIPANLKLESEINAGIELCRNECGYFAFCGGGSPGTKFYEHGTFVASETQECRYSKKLMTEVLLENVRRHQEVVLIASTQT
jgi:uncharacterized protein